MPSRLLLRLIGLGAGLAAAAPAWAQSGADSPELAKTLAKGIVIGTALLVIYGLLVVFCWLGIPLLLGVAGRAIGQRLDPEHRAGVWGSLLLATLVWVGGLDRYGAYLAALRPATEEAPGVVARLLDGHSLLAVPGLLAATLGAAVAGYFLARTPRPPVVPPPVGQG